MKTIEFIRSRLARVWWILISFKNPLAVLPIYLGFRKQGTDVVLTLRNGVKCKLADDNLCLGFHLFRDVWDEQAYGAFEGVPKQASTVIDIGAHIGTFAVYAAYHLPEAEIYCFEPDAENLALLEENIRINKLDSRVNAFPFAISDADGKVRFYRSSVAPSRHSLAQDSFLETETAGFNEVEAKTLTTILTEHLRGGCDLLKLDCEGAEGRILNASKGEVLGTVPHIVMEYHDGIGGTTLEQLKTLLLEEGYQISVEPNREVTCLGVIFAHRA